MEPPDRSAAKPAHHFIRYRSVQPLVSEASALAAYAINHPFKRRLSVSALRKLGTLDGRWTDGEGKQHQFKVNFDDLVEHVRTTRGLNARLFELPDIECFWLEGLTMFGKPDAPILRSDLKAFATFAIPTQFGDSFPLQPTIDREGAAYPSLQGPILANIVRTHGEVVAHSDNVTSWDLLNTLRALLNDCVAAVDVTLHQLYFIAEHRGSEFGWRFDRQALGDRHGQRLKDKLAWIGKITGRPLDDARNEVASFTVLKDLRNHLTHFDPPCFAYTMEDMVSWLNRVPAVGRLLWKMRVKMNAQLSSGLMTIILMPPVEFVPTDASAPRVPQPDDVGYRSTSWKD